MTELARAQGKHALTHERLMRAYWEEALNIGDLGVLRTLAGELGLEGAEASISGNQYRDQVERWTTEAHAIGINAIPAYLLDRRLIVLGAQPDPAFEQAIDQLERGSASAHE
jgi:predicted DsbA family dithiol-disulfide isomerase